MQPTTSLPPHSNQQTENDTKRQQGQRYLIYTIGGELFGSRLLHISEIAEPQPCKPIPSTVPHFLGILNMRGQILGVIDMRIRFGHEPESTEKLALIVFETDKGTLAAVVDSVNSVSYIKDEDIQKDVQVSTRVPLDYFQGIARVDNQLISLIDLKNVLTDEDFTVLAQARSAAYQTSS